MKIETRLGLRALGKLRTAVALAALLVGGGWWIIVGQLSYDFRYGLMGPRPSPSELRERIIVAILFGLFGIVHLILGALAIRSRGFAWRVAVSSCGLLGGAIWLSWTTWDLGVLETDFYVPLLLGLMALAISFWVAVSLRPPPRRATSD